MAILDKLEPKFAEKVQNLLVRAKDLHVPSDIFMGYRSWEQQDLLYQIGRTARNIENTTDDRPMGNIVTKAKGGESWHNYGLAVDIVFKPAGRWSWDRIQPWKALGELGEEQGLEWGGRWNFVDLPHFQMKGGLTIAKAKEFFKQGGLVAVWGAI